MIVEMAVMRQTVQNLQSLCILLIVNPLSLLVMTAPVFLQSCNVMARVIVWMDLMSGLVVSLLCSPSIIVMNT